MIKTIWRQVLADRVTAFVEARMAKKTPPYSPVEEVEQLRLQIEIYKSRVDQLESKMAILDESKPWKKNLYIPQLNISTPSAMSFMVHSTVSAADFYHPEFRSLCSQLGLEPMLHRKYWEWAYVLHHAVRLGVVGKGRRVLGFAVGQEPLPSAFAAMGTQVVATDAPPELGESKGWRETNEHAASLAETHKPDLIGWDEYQTLTIARPCDMTKIDPELTGFDLCWSSCSFEHLGSLEAGLKFVEESVERTLTPGGVAIHTTEFNLSSNDATIETGSTVLYRLGDIESFVRRMRARGHLVEPVSIAPDAHVLDYFVDTPPYKAPVHLKLELMGYVSTSIGLIIRRGT
jgi:hypothetical protein